MKSGGGKMLYFTRRAIDWAGHLQRTLNRPDSGLRVAVIGGGKCAGYEYFVGFEDEPREDDFRFQAGDIPVYVDPLSHKELEGATVDFTDTENGSGFVVALHPDVPARHTCCCEKDGKKTFRKPESVSG
jgi:iron-sulfur cluster insertion protein